MPFYTERYPVKDLLMKYLFVLIIRVFTAVAERCRPGDLARRVGALFSPKEIKLLLQSLMTFLRDDVGAQDGPLTYGYPGTIV